MIAWQMPLSLLVATLLHEIFEAVGDSANEQNAAFVELAAMVGVPLTAYEERRVGTTDEERRLIAVAHLREVVLPLLSFVAPDPLPRVIPLTADGRQRLIDYFQGVTAVLGTGVKGELSVIEATIRPVAAQNRWTILLDVLVLFTLARLRRDAEFSYRKTKALLATGLQKVAVTSGQLTAKITLHFSAAAAGSFPPTAPPVGLGRGRARFATADTTIRSPSEACGRLRPLGLQARIANESVTVATQSPDVIGSVRIDFRIESFPPLQPM